ncbi:methionyl-tRNA formyltransferase [Haloplanus halophilus]|uniref:methionyl-tRNA formyltransferase n=1 Tax=Haloplanus halophilus TaxID=2949993 RepID=UPI00203B7495|nr:formyltransferase family protein [Haloplanus sp. GDY1]
MRVVVVTSEEPLYMPRYLRRIVAAHAGTIDRIVCLPFPASSTRQLREYRGMYGPRAGAWMGCRYLRGRGLAALPGRLGWRLTGRPHSVRAVGRRHGVPVERVPDASAPGAVEYLRGLDPDLLLSVVAGQRLPGPVLDAAADAVNLHGSLLPRYRGRATAFWPLFYGDDRTGVTAHRMTERFDAGPILARREFAIGPTDTVDSVYRRLASTGAALATELLADYPDLPDERPNEPSADPAESYHGLPTAAERREFLARGNAFL